jgi:hypothetical protein
MRRRGVLVTRSGRRSKDGCSSRRSPSGERRGRRPPAAARSGLAGRRWPSPRRIGQGQEVGEDAEARGSGRRHPDVERLHRADRRRRRGARPAAGRRRPARGRPPPSGCRCRANDGRVLPGRFGANSASQSVSRSRPHRYRSARVPPIIEVAWVGPLGVCTTSPGFTGTCPVRAASSPDRQASNGVRSHQGRDQRG